MWRSSMHQSTMISPPSSMFLVVTIWRDTLTSAWVKTSMIWSRRIHISMSKVKQVCMCSHSDMHYIALHFLLPLNWNLAGPLDNNNIIGMARYSLLFWVIIIMFSVFLVIWWALYSLSPFFFLHVYLQSAIFLHVSLCACQSYYCLHVLLWIFWFFFFFWLNMGN